jgi:hypothetical protein
LRPAWRAGEPTRRQSHAKAALGNDGEAARRAARPAHRPGGRGRGAAGLRRRTGGGSGPTRNGAVGHAAVRRIARDPALLSALRSGNATALRAAALRQLFNPGKHVVRLGVLRDGRPLTDVGGAFVVAPARLELGGGDTLVASMQDVVGYVKLVRRLTGAQVVVRGAPGHVESSLPAAARLVLPAAGDATIAGHTYVVRSFHERGYGAEQLDVWILSG